MASNRCTLSVAAMVPVIGIGATVTKTAKNTLTLVDGVFFSKHGLSFVRNGTDHRLFHTFKHSTDDLLKRTSWSI